MTPDNAAPPRIAEWLLRLVATPDQFSAISGDLLEEFSAIALRSGIVAARRWYWRQSARTIAHLIGSHARHAPAETVTFAIGGFVLYVLAERVVQISAEAAGSHTRAYFYLSAVSYWRAVTAVERYLVPVMIGWLVARAVQGREVMAALSVGSIATTWILAFYTSWLLANAGFTPIPVPDFSMTPMLFAVHSGPPHTASLSNTLTHLQLTLIYCWIPMVAALLIGATMRRMTSPAWILTRETAQ